MNTFKYAAIIAVVVISGVIGFMSIQESKQPQLSAVAMANIEALTTGEVHGAGGMASKYCPIWNVTYKPALPFPEITCSTGGAYKCENEKCPHGS